MEEFLNLVFGELSASQWAASLVFILIGQLARKVALYQKKEDSTRFNALYWVLDNWHDMVLALVIAFVTIRFSDDLLLKVEAFISFGVDMLDNVFLFHIVIGFCLQFLARKLRNKIVSFGIPIDGEQ